MIELIGVAMLVAVVFLAIVSIKESKSKAQKSAQLEGVQAPPIAKKSIAEWWTGVVNSRTWLRGWPRVVALLFASVLLIWGILPAGKGSDLTALSEFSKLTAKAGAIAFCLAVAYVLRRVFLHGFDLRKALDACTPSTRAWIIFSFQTSIFLALVAWSI